MNFLESLESLEVWIFGGMDMIENENLSKGEVMLATVDDIPGWIKLVDIVKDNFPGFEKESSRLAG